VAITTLVMAALSIAVTGITLRHHAWTASGADASGYVSQAELWRHGSLFVSEPLALDAPWPEPEWTFSPLGYRPGPGRGVIVPTYPAGLPLTLAAAQLVGGRDAAYVAVPLIAGLGIWVTFLLGRQSGGRTVGVVAAVLLAVCPIYLRQATQVMSDVPAAVWWTLALMLAQRPHPRAAFGAGLAASLAIVTRPNLAFLALAIAAACVAQPGFSARAVARRVLLLGAGIVPGCLLVAVVHTSLYGSPLRSGYGSNADLYALANVPVNARLYASWLVEGQTSMLLLAIGALVFRRRSAAALEDTPKQAQWPLWLLVVLVVLAYLPYAVFEDWWYIRFLLPAFPAVFVLIALGLAGAATRLPRRVAIVSLTLATGALAGVSIVRAQTLHTFDLARDERRYAQMADALTTHVPTRSAFVAMQHSGSVHYYLDRPILRWELVPPERLEAALAYVRARGYRPYILLDSWEAFRFRDRFAHASPLGRLDWPPILELRSPTPVRLFDPSDRARYFGGEKIPTRLVFQPRR
jgi:hypothetical protein